MVELRDHFPAVVRGQQRKLGVEACKIELRLDYTFSSRVLEAVLAPVFSHITNTFVDAFVRRADALFVS